MLVVERLLGLRAAGGVYVPLGSSGKPRGMVARRRGRAGLGLREHRPPRRRTSSARSSTGRSSRCATPTPACAAASWAASPTPAPGTAAAPIPRSAGARDEPDAAEQERAVARRDCSLMVRAGAGTGKTTVLVERFVQAVAEDGVAVESILAITFTEKAAAEMKHARAPPLPRARPARRRPRRRGRLDLDHPRLLLARAARARAQRRHRPRLPGARRAGGRAHRHRRLRRGARRLHGRGRGARAARDGGRLHARPPARHGAHRPRAAAQPGRAPSAPRGGAAAARSGPSGAPRRRPIARRAGRAGRRRGAARR